MMAVLLAMVALSVVAVVMYRRPLGFRMVRTKQRTHLHKAIRSLAILTIFLPSLASAHGNVAMEEDSCVRRVGGNLVHLNAYQPQYEAKAHYCTEIPDEGETFLVVDLVDPSLRTMPVGVRVVRGIDGAAEDETVAYWPPAPHLDGVVRGEATLVKGLYTLIITPEGVSPSSYLLRVQQVDYTAMARNAMGPITIILLFVVIGYEFSKSRRVRNWRVSGHS
jgi:hypothetical protein